jgi:hypothetical protein
MSMPATRKTPADASRARPHGLQDADLLPLLGHEEDEMADDGEAGHEHDDGDDDEERELLQLKGREEVSIHPHPVAHPQPRARHRHDAPADRLRVEGVVELHLDAGYPVTQTRELLGGGERGVGERGIVLVEPHLDIARDLESAHLRHEADGRHGALRRNHGHEVAGYRAEGAGELSAEKERGLSGGAQERIDAPALELGGKLGADGRRCEVYPAKEPARRAPALAGEQRLLDDEGRGRAHAGDAAHAQGDLPRPRHATPA